MSGAGSVPEVPAPGALLVGRYQLAERVGAGGMGQVWRATDQVLSRVVAVKLMRPELVADPGFAQRFLTEARTMATIRHAGVVSVHDYHSDDSGAFLVMEYVDGESLSGRLSRLGQLAPAQTMRLLAQAADALQAAHVNGIVHRDIKPGNLLVTEDDTLVLTDFGIARSASATPVTATGAVLGTPAYLAPEQVLGKPATARSDLYALGVVGYECLTGRRPFEADNPFEVAMKRLHGPPPALGAGLPAAAVEVIERALATDPEQRWSSATEFADACRRAASASASGSDPSARPPLPPTRQDYLPGRAQPPASAQPEPTGQGPAGQGSAWSPVPPAGNYPQSPPSGHPAAPGGQSRPGHPAPSGQQPAGHPWPGHPQPSYPPHSSVPPGHWPASGYPNPPGYPVPAAWAPPRRPATVLNASILLCVAAGGLFLYSAVSLLALEEALAIAESVYGAGFDGRSAMAGGVLLTCGLLVLFGLLFLLLAAKVAGGRGGARGWTFTLAFAVMFCAGPCWWLADPNSLASAESTAEFGRALVDRMPTWYEPLSGFAVAITLAALLVTLVLLVLPPSNRYLRRPAGPVYPYHYYGYPPPRR